MSRWRRVWRATADPGVLASTHGVFNILGGAWPLAHLRSFEAVFGRKTDRWLVRTVAGLLVANGTAQLVAARRGEVATGRAIGIGTACALATIDAVYVPRGRISRTYLVDLAAEAAILAAWTRTFHAPGWAAAVMPSTTAVARR